MSGVEFDTTEPSAALESQLSQGESLAWMSACSRTARRLGWIGKGVLAIPVGILLVVFVGPFPLIMFIFVGLEAVLGDAAGGLIGFLLAVLGFFGLLLGPSLLCLGYGLLVGYFGRFEYAATGERLLALKDTPIGTTTSSVPVDRVRDVEYSCDTVDKFLNTGDVTIQGVRDADRVVFDNVSDGDAVVRAVREHAGV
jgi:hypothetical protein